MSRRASHAAIRAQERMGKSISGYDLKGMSLKIIRGEAIALRPRRDGKEQWLVTWSGRAYRVVYNPLHECIMTVLMPLRKGRKHRGPRRWREAEEDEPCL